MLEKIILLFRTVIKNDYVSLMLLSVLPIIEIRGAVPIAVAMGIEPFVTVLLSAISGTMAVIPNMIFVKPLINRLKQSKMYMLVSNFEKDILKKGERLSKKNDFLRYLSLSIFVALPIVFSGAYTGSTVAVFMGLNFSKSLVSIFVGNLLCSGIMLLLSTYFKEQIDMVVLALSISFIIAILIYIIKIIATVVKLKKAKEM